MNGKIIELDRAYSTGRDKGKVETVTGDVYDFEAPTDTFSLNEEVEFSVKSGKIAELKIKRYRH